MGFYTASADSRRSGSAPLPIRGGSLLQRRTVPDSATLTRRDCTLYASAKIFRIPILEALAKSLESRQELRIAEKFGRLNSPIAVKLTFQLALDYGCDVSISTASEA
jgi:hypothetical protein